MSQSEDDCPTPAVITKRPRMRKFDPSASASAVLTTSTHTASGAAAAALASAPSNTSASSASQLASSAPHAVAAMHTTLKHGSSGLTSPLNSARSIDATSLLDMSTGALSSASCVHICSFLFVSRWLNCCLFRSAVENLKRSARFKIETLQQRWSSEVQQRKTLETEVRTLDASPPRTFSFFGLTLDISCLTLLGSSLACSTFSRAPTSRARAHRDSKQLAAQFETTAAAEWRAASKALDDRAIPRVVIAFFFFASCY